MTIVIQLIREKNPQTKLAICSIFFRPQDIPEQMAVIRNRKAQRPSQQYKTSLPSTSSSSTLHPTPTTPPAPQKPLTKLEKYNALHPLERKRRTTNKALGKLCSTTGVIFLESWRCVQKIDKNKEKIVNLDCFADDGLHLNEQGIAALGEYIEGNVQRHLPLKRPQRIRKQTKPIK
jgi:hypothetical protein